MKKILFSSFFLTTVLVLQGQNFIPNGDFELFTSCPTNQGQIYLASPWISPNTSQFATDYFNQCSSNSGSAVPVNNLGYQLPHSGTAYSGIFLLQGVGANVKEYLEIPLSLPLAANGCYHFEMYVSLGNVSMYSSDNIGVYFSDTAVTGITSFSPLPFSPQIINATGNFPDSVSWIKVEGNYTASGTESHIIIGCFLNDAQMNLVSVNASGLPYSYVYVEDVSLSPCTSLDFPDFDIPEYVIYPNPANDNFEFRIPNSELNNKNVLTIKDISGKEVLKSQILKPKSQINISSLRPGIYFVTFTAGEISIAKKLIIASE